jgi:pyruvate formate lyase activating enzyme
MGMSPTANDLAGTIFNIMRFSVYDGPGIRTTVFLKGCPASCLWCHNPEALSGKIQLMVRKDRCRHCGDCAAACPRNAISLQDGETATDWKRCLQCGACVEVCYAEARELVGRSVTVRDLLKEISRDIPFFEESGGGVTFSGGEPLQQHEFLQEILKACKERGLHTAVDTTGYAPPEVLRRIAGWTDLFLYDLKLMNDLRHREFTGISNGVILQNLKDLAAGGNQVQIRVPLVPGINDSRENIGEMGRFVATLPNVKEIELLPYHTAGGGKYERLGMKFSLPGITPLSNPEMEWIIEELRRNGISVHVGNDSPRH